MLVNKNLGGAHVKKMFAVVIVILFLLVGCLKAEPSSVRGRAKRLAQTGEWIVRQIRYEINGLIVILEAGDHREIFAIEKGGPHFEDYLSLELEDKVVLVFDPGGKENSLQAFLWPAKRDKLI